MTGQWLYLAIHDAACVCAGAYLVVNDHLGWAGLCFLMAIWTSTKSTITVKEKKR